jgi:hypothetical protein
MIAEFEKPIDQENDRSCCTDENTSSKGGLYIMMKRNALWALLAVGMTAVLVGEVNAQWPLPKMGLLGEFRKKSIVGSWEETVRFPSDVPVPQQRAVMSFHDGGTVVSSGQGIVTLNPPPGSVESDSLGAWVQLDWRTFGYTNVAVLSDLNGNLTGFFKVRGVYQLDSSGDSYTGHSYYEFLDTDHKPTNTPVPPGWVCNDGVRISVEAPPKDPPPPEHCVPEKP